MLVAELDQWSGELKSVLGGFAYLTAVSVSGHRSRKEFA